jgi:hypothetical protein
VRLRKTIHSSLLAATLLLPACASHPSRFDAGLDLGVADTGIDGGVDSGSDVGADADVDAAYPTPAPRPLAPLSTSTVTSQRPTLRWSLPPGTDGAHVDICADRACATIDAMLDVTGSSTVPTTSLAAGVHFWRVRGRMGASIVTAYSPTWEFWVGARSAGDSSWGTTPDVNGDGRPDLIVGAMNFSMGTGRAYVYLGTATGLPNTATATLDSPDGEYGLFGASVASAGDVNGDGFGDVVVGAPAPMLTGGPPPTLRPGSVHLYLGGVAGLSTTATMVLAGPDGIAGAFGNSVASAGDVNGDGFADVVVGAPGVAMNSGRAYVYLGSANGLSATPLMLAATSSLNDRLGETVSGAGDVNGDGLGDVIVGAAGTMSNRGAVYLFLGTVSGPPQTVVTLMNPDSGSSTFGESVACAGDVDGDGLADVVIGSLNLGDGTGNAHVYLGNASGLSATPASTLSCPDGPPTGCGRAVSSAGDVNGDGYADVVIGAPDVTLPPMFMVGGRAYVFLGGATGLGAAPELTAPGMSSVALGTAVAAGGDLNGDGFADVIIGTYNGLEGVVIYNGGSAGIGNMPSQTIPPPDGVNTHFGFSIAERDPARIGRGMNAGSFFGRAVARAPMLVLRGAVGSYSDVRLRARAT